MTTRHRFSEGWLAELDDIVRRYRLGLRDCRASERLTYEEALALLRKLGLTTGEAIRVLRPYRDLG